MFEYELLEKQLNEDVKKILLLIKQDYYDTFSDKKKELIDNLIEYDKVVIVNQGISHFNDNTLAHGGRALGDGKIHFYPDARKFKSLQEAFVKGYEYSSEQPSARVIHTVAMYVFDYIKSKANYINIIKKIYQLYREYLPTLKKDEK